LGITTTALPDAPVARAYSAPLAVFGGTGPYSWSLVDGSLPAGLHLTAGGTVTGTPTVVGTSTFTVRVRDSSSPKNSATHTVTLTVVPMAITNSDLPDGVVQKAYPTTTLTVSGGAGSRTWSVVDGSLPTGMKLSPTFGTLSGTPTATGSFTFTVHVSDGSNPANEATKQFTIVIAPMSIVTTSLPDAKVKSTYSQTLTLNGGKKAFTWTVTSGALPAGLHLTAGTGTISGAPKTAGTYTFTVHVTDSGTPTNSADQTLTLVVDP